jgi:S-formylglutathione hydrolase FrmB
LLDLPLIAGPFPTGIEIAGGLAAIFLIARRGRGWWLRSVPVAVGVGIAVAALSAVYVAVAKPFPDALPLRVLVWIAVGSAAVALAVAGRGGGRTRALVSVVAALLVLATSGMKVNAFYGYRPTMAAAFGLPAANEVQFADLARILPAVTASPGRPLSTVWRPPADMPRTGRISHVDIPGTTSGFVARQAWLYLPPAYFASTRATLPVLELLPGQPGGPEDWLLAGRLAEVLDTFAAAHGGLAPVVVVPDATGTSFGNPLCLDSRLGNTETYLATDVPAWMGANLQIDAGHFAVGGFSFGGTCALELAVRRPEVFPTFLDVSGQAEPTLGDRAQTVAAAFGGDEDAFRRVNPLDELRTARFPDTAGVLAVGADDPVYGPEAEQVRAAARQAGMTVTLKVTPGGHSWTLAVDALTGTLPWLAGRMGLLAPAPS